MLVGSNLHFHFEGRDVFATSADGILAPVNEVEVAVFILPEHIAGVKPPAPPGFSCRVRAIQVAGIHGVRRPGAKQQFTFLSDRNILVVFVHKPRFVMRPPLPQLAAAGRHFNLPVQAADRVARFRHVVAGAGHHAKALVERFDVWQHRCHQNILQGMQTVVRCCGLTGDEVRHGADQQGDGTGVTINVSPERLSLEAGSHHESTANGYHQQRQGSAGNVIGCTGVVIGFSIAQQGDVYRCSRCIQLTPGNENPFRRSRGSGRVDDTGDVFQLRQNKI